MSTLTAQAPLLVTMGDPCGIGPETIVRAWSQGAFGDALVVGDAEVMQRAAAACHLDLPVVRADEPSPAQVVRSGEALRVWSPPGLPAGLDQCRWGEVDARAGAAAAICVQAAAALALSGRARALVTAPLHKEALAAAGVAFPGHTELLQSLCVDAAGRMPPVRMMLANGELRVVLVTIHVALRQAIDALDIEGIVETLRITHAAGASIGLHQPRIAVAGLNPHAGEGGLFGDEEVRIIRPAVDAARQMGIDARGPFAPDTVFMRARNVADHPGEFDFVVAMVHDHGLIPVKYLGVEHGVNVTLGLPFVRTSPDHGTAFDLAGSGRADPSSLMAAARMARMLSDKVSAPN